MRRAVNVRQIERAVWRTFISVLHPGPVPLTAVAEPDEGSPSCSEPRQSSAGIWGRPHILHAFLSDAPSSGMYIKREVRFGVHSTPASRGRDPPPDPAPSRRRTSSLPAKLPGVFVFPV